MSDIVGKLTAALLRADQEIADLRTQLHAANNQIMALQFERDELQRENERLNGILECRAYPIPDEI